ncbi:MAG: hypothetical protein JWP40_4751 [Blastococcus sp.]|nr:hypothetical protein [Blastococcus sp.]
MPGGRRPTGVDLHSAVQLPIPPNDVQHVTPISTYGPREAEPGLPILIAYVPFFSEGLAIFSEDLCTYGSDWVSRAENRTKCHLVGHLWRLSTASRMPSSPGDRCDGDKLRDAPVRVTQQPLATRWRGCRAAGGERGSASQQGVPVVLPVRKGSPGGSYGTAAYGHMLCPAVFPVEVPPLRTGDDEQRCPRSLMPMSGHSARSRRASAHG